MTQSKTHLICFIRSCKDYREHQKAARFARRKSRVVSESAEPFMTEDHSCAESTSSWGVVDLDQADDEGDAVQFLKQPSGSESAWCSYFFLFDPIMIAVLIYFKRLILHLTT